ncbi:MAG: hypothetical protein EA401_06700 [Planctomycetota bacterium]|nr:MAG: hypothetical protein EA401_06700 [Planctomycetota bacterium]
MSFVPFDFNQQQHLDAFLQRYPAFSGYCQSANIDCSHSFLSQTIAQCCERAQASAVEVLASFAMDYPEERQADDRDWTEATLDELVANLIEGHHDYVRVQLGRMQVLLDCIVAKAPHCNERLDRARAALTFLSQRWHSHMDMEERDFFPVCLRLEASRDLVAPEELDALIRALHRTSHDHRDINMYADRFEQAIDVAKDDIPPDLVPMVCALEQALQDFIDDARLHSAKEDDILIPAVLFAHDVRRSDNESGRFSRIQ